MNPSTIVCGMKWNWTVSFAMWSTTRSALVWQRIHAPGLGRARGWQAKAPAPRLARTLAKCRNSRRWIHPARSAKRQTDFGDGILGSHIRRADHPFAAAVLLVGAGRRLDKLRAPEAGLPQHERQRLGRGASGHRRGAGFGLLCEEFA